MDENITSVPETLAEEAPHEHRDIVGQHEYIFAGSEDGALDQALVALKETGVKVLNFERDRGKNWRIKTMAPRS